MTKLQKFVLGIVLILKTGALAQTKDPVEGCNPWRGETKSPECVYNRTREMVACIEAPNAHDISWSSVTPNSFVGSWNAVPEANCYHVVIVYGYTTLPVYTIPCYRDTVFEATELQSGTQYGIIVRAVDRFCNIGPPGLPARTHTIWTPTVETTTKKTLKTKTPQPKTCGRGFFTCHSNPKECVRNKFWCNRVLNCEDGSDERACPGGCMELDIDFKNGNYSCSRWGSPGSVCRFDCKKDFELHGFKRIQCKRKPRKWNRSIPTCRLTMPKNLKVLNDESTDETLTIEWQPVPGASYYTIVVVEQPLTKGKKNPPPIIKNVGTDECCETTVTDLKPLTEFMVTMRAIDENEIDGKESNPAFGRTLKRSPDESVESE